MGGQFLTLLGDSPEPVGCCLALACGAGGQNVPQKTLPAQGLGLGLCHWIFPSLGKRTFTPALEQLSRRQLGRGRLKEILPSSVVSMELNTHFLLRDRVEGTAVL